MASVLMCGVEDLLLGGSRCVWTLTVTALRRWYAGRLRACRQALRAWCGLGDVYQMTEGRHCQVHLLDDRNLELLVQPKLLSRELLDLVASHFNLKEKEYFGITFIDDTGQSVWLQLDHRVLDHDLPKKPGPATLYFAVRFYIESISFLKDKTTVELFFLNAKSCVHKGQIEVESETVFKLAALVLQEAKGDYSSDENTRKDLKTLPVFPTKTLQEHPSLAYCEDRVIEHYTQIKGLTRGQAIVQYMRVVEALPTYGVHYYGVKDKQGIPWWLGISYKGIGQYDLQDKVKPRKLFQWKQLENLYFREKKFAVEVHDPRRISVSRRTFGQSGLVVQTWYANTSLIKSIWVMAISQHQFYLDRKQSKAKIPSARSLDDIAMDLTEMGTPKVSKLVTLEAKNQLIMASNGSLISSGSQDSEVSEEQKKEKIMELKKKEKLLQEKLLQKVEELKKICLREAELTGKMPKEYPLSAGEEPPQVRRRVGTAFKLDDNLLPTEEDPALQELESNFIIQQKLVEAAKKLAGEPDLCKNVKKKRKQEYADAVKKLQEIENSINEYRIKCGKKPTQKSTLTLPDDIIPSESSSLSDTTTYDDAGSESLSVPAQRTSSAQLSPRLLPPKSLGLERVHLRKSSMNEQLLESRHSRDPLSTHSSPYRTLERPAPSHGGRSMPTTPVLTRNAYSSSHLQPDVSPHHCRQRSGSLESQTHLLSEVPAEKTAFSLTKSQRSSSTEILDDGSSYTSQSSTEYYCVTPTPKPYYTTQTLDNRTRGRRRSKKQHISAAGSGSMPNLAQKDVRNGVYHKSQEQPSSSYYISGYSPYTESDVYYNGGYVYESDTEGQYSVNPSYRSSAHYGYDRYREFRSYNEDEVDRVPHNPYATLRLPRKQVAKTEHITKNIHKALVAEHLRGWYQRASSQKEQGHCLQAGFESDRGSQRSLGFAGLQVPCSPSSRVSSFSSASSGNTAGNWRNPLALGLSDYDTLSHSSFASSYGNAYGNLPLQSRAYPEPSQLGDDEENQLEEDLHSSEQRLFWHEDSKPGTLV
ncbi:FERM domain-containing protein 4B isoform X4 [Numida meleagris]|uniref:FERM domain-containing protein 4B isoform X4 n=1 Tax=Numida meleagris TaxID=8996 RepID=UPI000B3E0326|nr:FERM domain-containing protein 4B isoform X4 [Numida meleagris]